MDIKYFDNIEGVWKSIPASEGQILLYTGGQWVVADASALITPP